jgi:hypothetical protein
LAPLGSIIVHWKGRKFYERLILAWSKLEMQACSNLFREADACRAAFSNTEIKGFPHSRKVGNRPPHTDNFRYGALTFPRIL